MVRRTLGVNLTQRKLSEGILMRSEIENAITIVSGI